MHTPATAISTIRDRYGDIVLHAKSEATAAPDKPTDAELSYAKLNVKTDYPEKYAGERP